ncbi:MAG: hypothetical protein NWE99_10620 [Candidatus Bathyarchaeota archaeon]|nr:hypothetical protein [Candidatus Bathyarchaeota archaeon]
MRAVGIAVALLVPGILSLSYSFVYNSQVLAFIGLGLTFWGAIFLLTRPVKYVKGSLLQTTATAQYATIDRIIKDFAYEGKAYYVPPYPKDAYLPEHLKGLKEMVVFISAGNEAVTPSLDEMAEGRFLLKKQKGVLVAPPGLGLLASIEKQMRLDLTKIDLADLCIALPRFITEELNLADAMEVKLFQNEVTMKISDSLFADLYGSENASKSIYLLGSPVVSAVACALAKTSGKPVTVQEQKLSSDGLTIDVLYRFMQG